MRTLVYLLITSGFGLSLYILFGTTLIDRMILRLKSSRREKVIGDFASEVVASAKDHEVTLHQQKRSAEEALEKLDRTFYLGHPAVVADQLQKTDPAMGEVFASCCMPPNPTAKKAARKRAPRKVKPAEQVTPQL